MVKIYFWIEINLRFFFVTNSNNDSLNFNKLIQSEESISLQDLYKNKKYIFDTTGKIILEHWSDFYDVNKNVIDNPQLNFLFSNYLDTVIIEHDIISKIINTIDSFEKY